MKKIVAIICLIFTANIAKSQIAIEWQHCFGVAEDAEYARAMKQTPDGGIIIAGTNSGDCLLLKIDSLGNQQWTQTYGGTSFEYFYDVVVCADGGYLGVGYTNSNDGDVVGFHPGCSQCIDGWIVKTDANGNLMWQRSLGGSERDAMYSAVQNQNNEYIVAGFASSSNGDLTNISPGWVATWILRIDSMGVILQQAIIGGGTGSVGNKITETNDGGYALACTANTGGGILDTAFGGADVYIMKVDTGLNVLWAHVYGGSGGEVMYDIKQTADGGFIMCGWTGSMDGYVSGNHGNMDFWVVKTDSIGHFEWQKCLGSSYYEDAYSILQTSSGNYLLTGRLFGGAIDGDITNPIGADADFWIVCLDPTGNLLWQKSIGGGSYDQSYALIALNDGSYAAAGVTGSNDFDVSGFHSISGIINPDLWCVKFTDHPNAITGNIFIDANSNSIMDSVEVMLPIHKITEANTGRMAFSNSSGFYRLDIPATGAYTVTADCVNYYTCMPASQSATFLGIDQIDSLNHFALQPTGSITEVSVFLTASTNVRPGFPTMFHITYKNIGTVTASGDLSFTTPSSMSFASASIAPLFVAADSIIWNYTNLLPQEERSIDVTLSISSGIPIGTTVLNSVYITPIIGDVNISNNNDSLYQIVVGSFDPNDITVDKEILLTNQVANPPYLEYTIRFQNTGTFPATFVRVTNPISNLLDMSSFELIATSHAATTNYLTHSGNMVFEFNNINLTDSATNEQASHGFISYRIRPKTNLVVGDSILNYANIYFDFNYPVITNTAITTIVSPLGVTKNDTQIEQLYVYPNPFNHSIVVDFQKQNAKQISTEVVNCLGQTLKNETYINTKQARTKTIDLSFLPRGMYYLAVTIDGEKIVKKIIKD